jgi:hypothetical protein
MDRKVRGSSIVEKKREEVTVRSKHVKIIQTFVTGVRNLSPQRRKNHT